MSEAERGELLAAADRIEQLATRSTRGEWELRGLLATRPEVVAHRADGTTEHVAEARAASARWIVALSPAVAPALRDWLRGAARRDDELEVAALSFAREILRH